MTKHKRKEADNAALEILRSTGADVLEAALVAKAAMEAARGKVKRALKCIRAGAEALRLLEKTVTFEKAVETALEVRRDRRTRTVYDFRYFTRRFIKRCKGLARRRVRSITPQECAEYIETAFDTPRQRQKARLILSGVFSTAVKRGWCDANPVSKVEAPRVVEQPVPILTPQEIEQITTTAEAYQGGSCAAAVGMMLYAGIRPHEMARLTWAQVDLQARAIYILPRHSKTGGARRVTIHRPLLRILRKRKGEDNGLICPRLRLGLRQEMAAGCAAAYLCELPPEPFPQLCGAAGGDWASGCLAAKDALCGPARGARGGTVLGSLKWILNVLTHPRSRAGFHSGKACFHLSLARSVFSLVYHPPGGGGVNFAWRRENFCFAEIISSAEERSSQTASAQIEKTHRRACSPVCG